MFLLVYLENEQPSILHKALQQLETSSLLSYENFLRYG